MLCLHKCSITAHFSPEPMQTSQNAHSRSSSLLQVSHATSWACQVDEYKSSWSPCIGQIELGNAPQNVDTLVASNTWLFIQSPKSAVLPGQALAATGCMHELATCHTGYRMQHFLPALPFMVTRTTPTARTGKEAHCMGVKYCPSNHTANKAVGMILKL